MKEGDAITGGIVGNNGWHEWVEQRQGVSAVSGVPLRQANWQEARR